MTTIKEFLKVNGLRQVDLVKYLDIACCRIRGK